MDTEVKDTTTLQTEASGNNATEEKDKIQNEEKVTDETQQKNNSESVPDQDIAKIESQIQQLIIYINQMDYRTNPRAIEYLFYIIALKKQLNKDYSYEMQSIVALTVNLNNKEFTKKGLEIFYMLREIISPDNVEETSNLYQYICTCEMILGNSDAAQFVIEEALKYITENGQDKSGLLTSGLVRQRTKIYENRKQYKEYVDDLKLSVSILENVEPQYKSDYHDKYIAQMVPQYLEVEMEELKVFDFENQEKYLRRAYDIWKVREGDNPIDFCNFKTTYLLLVLLSKFKEQSEYQLILEEAEKNIGILKPMFFQSGQYMSIYLKSLLLVGDLKKKSNSQNPGESESEKDNIEQNKQESADAEQNKGIQSNKVKEQLNEKDC